MKTIHIDCRKIVDQKTFHDVFAIRCEFPEDYGCNMDAWIDCMSDLKARGSVVVLQLEHVDSLSPKLFKTLVDGHAFVNRRQAESGHTPLLALAYERDE